MTSVQPAQVMVVTAPRLPLCEDAQDALSALAGQYRLTGEVVAAGSPAGQAGLYQHRTGMFPLVLAEGVDFSAGRLPRRQPARYLATRRTALAGVR